MARSPQLFASLVALLIAATLPRAAPSSLQPSRPGEGWAAADRFAAFRFECSDDTRAPEGFDRRAFAVELRDLADDLSAFGWVQVARAPARAACAGAPPESAAARACGSVVGEFRGTRRTAQLFRQRVERGPAGAPEPARGYRARVLEYPDTRVRLHFAGFPILESARRTCFESPPHECHDD